MHFDHSSGELAARRSSGTVLYRQIYVVLRDEIARGVYAATGVLPKEEALCERFQVSRITVRRALADLASTGVIERRHGLGTFVRPKTASAPAPSSPGFLESLRLVALETQVKVLQVGQAHPLPDVAALLQLPAGQTALRALRLRMIGKEPVMFTEAWLPATVGKGVTAAGLRRKPLYELLQELGVKFGRVVQEISAQAATPDVALHLRTETASPLIRLTRVMHDIEGRPAVYVEALLPPERSRIVMDIPGEKVNTLDAGRIMHNPR